MKQTGTRPAVKLAFCAVLAALETALMMIASFVPVGTYAVPCFAGAFTVAAVIEYGAKWAAGVYFVSGALSMFLCADKEAALLFALLFGYYPIIKNVIESKLKGKALQYAVKFVLFNAAAVGSFFISVNLLAIPAEEFSVGGVYVPYLFLAAGNVFFLLYDIMLTRFVVLYAVRIRKAIFSKLR